eukprot:gb/GEZN01005068.1/.p1 GENE.gb/GEZN01005068.1/~~gb/GEZN01005068.1/.p1  ORF type:complete len:405 (+),score=74.52 gb/GEZN01005068.1/:261-1475(+)
MLCFESDPEQEVDVPTAVPVHKATDSKQKNEDIREDIRSEKLNPLVAFEAFAGKLYLGPQQDASDAASKDPLRQISSSRSEFSHEVFAPSKKHFEAPLDRYNRLKSEVAAFQKDMEQLAQDKSGPDSVQEFSRYIVRDLGNLGKDLGTLEAKHGPLLEQASRASDQSLALLMAQVRALQDNTPGKTTKSETSAGAGAASASGGRPGAKYELYYTELGEGAGQTKRRTQQDLQALDQRLASLEQRLGSQDIPYPSLEAGVADLHKKLLLLDEASLDRVTGRVSQLGQAFDKLQGSQEKAAAAKKAGVADKVEEVFAQMNKWDSAAQRLPVVIERLHSLRYVHEEAADATLRLQGLETMVGNASKLMEEDREALDQLKAVVQSNAQRMEANVTSLQQRLAALAGKN